MHAVAHRFAGFSLAALLVAAGLGAQAQAPQHGTDHTTRPAATPSTSFTIGGAVQTPRTVTLADLQKQPATTEAVYFSTGRGPVNASFTGVLLWTLLSEAGIKTDAAVRNDGLRRSVVVSAADGYSVILSLGELDPEFGAAQALVAYAQDGKPLGDSGFARLILPADKGGGRNVMRINAIEVR
jgi:DMSO/TMAO reductase YedYZ molybdopterin-dependent catalytic subunit